MNVTEREILDEFNVYDSDARSFSRFFSKYEGIHELKEGVASRSVPFYERSYAMNNDVERKPNMLYGHTLINFWLQPFFLRETIVNKFITGGPLDNQIDVTFSSSIANRSNPETRVFKDVIKELKPFISFPKPEPLIKEQCEKNDKKICCNITDKSDICRCDYSTNQIDTILLDWRNLNSLPVCLKKYKKLENLFVSGQGLECIENINSLKKLRLLDASENYIDRIEGLEGLNNLQYLFLRGNSIRDIKGTETLKNLISLDLRGDIIDNVDGIENLKKLKHFFFKPVPDDVVMDKIKTASNKIGFYYSGLGRKEKGSVFVE